MAALADPPKFRTDGLRVVNFAEKFIRQTKGQWAGQPLTLLDWQTNLLAELYEVDDNGRFVYREALVGVPRKNGKSTLCAALALYGLLASGEPGAEVYVAAAAKDQARVVFDQAREFVDASPQLQQFLVPQRNAIICPATNGVFRVLSSDAKLQHGLNPSLVVIDELHAHGDPELYYALTTGQLARQNPLVVSITTAGFDPDSICYQVYEHGLRCHTEGTERAERFLFRWWQAPQGCDLDDEDAWRVANPSPWIGMDDLRIERRRLPEHVFRRLHLNQWTSAAEAWLPPGAWKACYEPGATIPPGSHVVAAVDLGIRHDSAAVVVVWKRGDGKYVVKSFILDPPVDGDLDIALVENKVRALASEHNWRVRIVAYDRMMFVRSAQMLGDEGFEMEEFPQTNERMAPASTRAYEAIVQRNVVHDGDQTLADHVAGGAIADSERGWRLTKRKATVRIDGLIAFVMGLDTIMNLPPPQRSAVHFF
jgi:phage terminase large subunit-like protein